METYVTQPFPKSRQLVVDAGWNAHNRHMIHGFLEVDVTEPRRFLREHKARTGESLSFTAFVLACLGQAVDADRQVHALRAWRNRVVLFEEVDVMLSMEVDLGNAKIPLIHVLRAVNRRTVRDLHDEIRGIQAQPERSPGMQFLRVAPWLPRFSRQLLYRIADRSPRLHKQYTGTVGYTSVGMFGTRGGWGLGMPIHTLAVTLGGMAEKPGVVRGCAELREVLNVTLSFDHDIVDGAPAARFASRFTDLIEHGYGLGVE